MTMRRDMNGDLHITLADTLARLSDKRLFDTVFSRDGDIAVELYRPRERDRQIPHDRDELYLVATGNGTFNRDGETVAFRAGDLLFVPAWLEHRFETFSDDFAVWVIFFGPKQQRRDSNGGPFSEPDALDLTAPLS